MKINKKSDPSASQTERKNINNKLPRPVGNQEQDKFIYLKALNDVAVTHRNPKDQHYYADDTRRKDPLRVIAAQLPTTDH